jgi:hypothetical protein
MLSQITQFPYFYDWIIFYIYIVICSWTLKLFSHITIMTNAEINTGVQILLNLLISFNWVYIQKQSFWRNFHTIFHSDSINLHLYISVFRVCQWGALLYYIFLLLLSATLILKHSVLRLWGRDEEDCEEAMKGPRVSAQCSLLPSSSLSPSFIPPPSLFLLCLLSLCPSHPPFLPLPILLLFFFNLIYYYCCCCVGV